MKILALDMSSTRIGLCYNGTDFETIALRGNIAERCAQASKLIAGWCSVWNEDIDLVVIESPVGRFSKALIPQARVSGAVLATLHTSGYAWLEQTPTEAKKALTGKGNADKAAMIAAAFTRVNRVMDEHQADAYGLWLAAHGKAVEVA